MVNKTFKFTGLKELDRALDSLTEVKFRKAALRNAGRKSMIPVLNDAKRRAPVLKAPEDNPTASPGKLRDDITMTTSVNVSPLTKKGKLSKSKDHELKVTVKTGKATEDYALVAEYGREKTTIIRSQTFGRPTKDYFFTNAVLKPQPYMRPALRLHVGSVLKTFSDELGDQIIKQAARQKKASK